jgi:hypothetical protein
MKILILTSGGSQFITQLAVLLHENINLDSKEVYVLYNGVPRDSLNNFFKEVCFHFKFNYIGQLNFNVNPQSISIKSLFFNFIQRKENSIFSAVRKCFPQLTGLIKSEIVFIPVRVKMFSDIVLLSYLKPKKIIYSVDGVVDELPKRNFKGLKFLYLKEYLKNIPMNQAIYSPNYLLNESKKIGNPTVVHQHFVIEKIKEISMVKQFKDTYLNKNINFIIFSQHYSLTENVTAKNELTYYSKIIKKVCEEHKNVQILFKPHPRDTNEKIQEIIKLNSDFLQVVEEKFQAIPIELFENEFAAMKTIMVTGNSSAPFCFIGKCKIIAVNSKKLLSDSLNLKIYNFAKENNFQLIEV